jgi:dihydrofolate synthase/folylpolyglutamate synthase
MLNKYTDCTEWLFSQFPSYQNLGASAYKPGLENTRAILAKVGNPETKLKFIHVAGTNGKGSTCAFLSSFLQETGYRVGLFTSPHLVDFRERIRVNGKAIKEAEVIEFCQQVQTYEADLSFFEITLAMALVHFNNEQCDYVILETGMGGRLDATNVVTPLLAVITNIGFDHQAFLGNTLAEIASEKAGIIKASVPVLCGEEREDLAEIFRQKAHSLHAPIVFSNERIDDPTQVIPAYQRKNAGLALNALSILGIDTRAINVQETWLNLFKQTGFIGRLFPSERYPNLWYDASHNADGLNTTIESLMGMGISNPIVIFGASNDKSLAHLSELNDVIDAWYFCEFTNPRSYRGNHLMQVIEELKLKKTQRFYEVNKAINAALENRKEHQAILVTGSFFLLSDCEEIQANIGNQLSQ